MLEVLKFIFSSFWHWLGTLVLVAVVSGGLAKVVYAFRSKDFDD
jgi:D-alanyl-lipoteichoic acid acyltransferase DltB (MBOAT superfamily)